MSAGTTLPVQYSYGSGNTGAIIRSGTATTGVNLTQTSLAAGTAFSLSFDVGMSGVSTSGRSFQLQLKDGNGQTPINLIAAVTAGGVKFQVYDKTAGTSGAFVDLTAAPVLTGSVYDTATATFTSLTMYHVVLQVDNFNSATGLSYSISYGLAGGTYTPLFTSGAMNYDFQTSGANSGLNTVNFFGTYGGETTDRGSYLLDNVVLSAIPEPTSLALMAGGLLLLCGRQVRRKY